MFTISWHETLVVTAFLTIGYYAAAALLFYRKEIAAWWKTRRLPKAAIVENPQSSPSPDLMGVAEAETGLVKTGLHSMALIESQSLQTAPATQEEEPITLKQTENYHSDRLLLGAVADLLEELKTVATAITDSGRGEAENVSLISSLLARYPHLASSRYRDAINLHILNSFKESINLTIDEIDSWWSVKSVNVKRNK